jgi:hypothetical protein
MSLFDDLGLQNIPSSLLPFYGSPEQQGRLGYGSVQAQQQYQPVYLCKHGADCPMCFEIAKKQGEEIKKREEIKTQKKLEYENRCKVYIKNFRRGR